MPSDDSVGGGGGLDLSGEQRRNATIIIKVGLRMGMSWRDIKIGLMTAMQESGLVNVNYGDRDSLGLFQQRPSQGWGTQEQVTDPQYAAHKFFSVLKTVGNREDMPLWQAAATVQRPAEEYETYYRKHFTVAGNMIKHFRADNPGATAPGGSPGDPGSPGRTPLATDQTADPLLALQKYLSPQNKKRGVATTPGIAAARPPGMDASIEPLVLPTFNKKQNFDQAMEQLGLTPAGTKGANKTRQQIIKFAKQFIGDPYEWGGTGPGGFDCSGLIYYVLNHFGYNVPRISYQLGQQGYNLFAGRRDDLSKLQAGDLVLWDNSSRNSGADHVAFYLGNGMILEAPRPGRSVGISELYDQDNAWGVKLKL